MREQQRETAARRRYTGRASRQRDAIAAVADVLTSAFTSDELAEAVSVAGERVGKATVYRTVAAMADAGWIEPVGSRAGAVTYARCRGAAHHHHLVCESCGRVDEAPCDVGDALERAAAACGFRATRHELSLYGVCAACAERREER